MGETENEMVAGREGTRKCTIPPADSFRGRVDVTAKVRRSAGAAEGMLGRMAKAGRRKSLEAIVMGCW